MWYISIHWYACIVFANACYFDTQVSAYVLYIDLLYSTIKVVYNAEDMKW